MRAAIGIGFLALYPCLAAELVKFELQGAGGEAILVAYPGPDHSVTQSQRLPDSEQPAGIGLTRMMPNQWTCKPGAETGPRLFVFSGNNAATYVEPREICGQLQSGKVVVAMVAPTEVNLFIWLRESKLHDLLLDEVANANWLASHNRAGVVYKPHFLVPGIDFKVTKVARDPKVPDDDTKFLIARPPHAPRKDWVTLHESDPDTNCDTLTPDAKLLRPGGINVFVGFQAGWTCLDRTADNVIFLPDVAKPLGVLAHELGHASGLGSDRDGNANLKFDTGHVPPKANGVAARGLFPVHNALVPDALILHETLTLGQVFWMNFSDRSYLAQTRAGKGVPNLSCPNLDLCPEYRVDFETPRKGAEFNVGCDVQSFSAGLNFHFTLTDGVSKELADQQPHYCTRNELLDVLNARFDEVCGASNREFGGPRCGHEKKAFVDTWMNRVSVAGVIQVAALATVQAMLNMQATRTMLPGSEAYKVYEAKAQRRAYDLLVDHPAALRKLQGARVLWVDSRENNRIEAALLEALGVQIDFRADGFTPTRNFFHSIPRCSAAISHIGNGEANELLEFLHGEKLKLPLLVYTRRVGPFIQAVPDAAVPFVETNDPMVLIGCVLQAAESNAKRCTVQP